MKVALVTILLVAVAAVCVSSTSVPRCDPGACEGLACPTSGPCACGSYKDTCECCEYCYKCADEECWPERNERCGDGMDCVRSVIGEVDVNAIPGRCTARDVLHKATHH
ncbi:8.6 kDa transglutaminase substrate-like [Haemaphysalis longicornis]